MSEFLQGWQNSHVPLPLPEIRGQQVNGSFCPREAKSTVPLLWVVPWAVSIEPQKPGPSVCNHISPELGPVRSMGALLLALNKVGLGPQWLYRCVERNVLSFLSVQGRTQVTLPWFYKQPFVIDIISMSIRKSKIKCDAEKCIKNTYTKGPCIDIAYSFFLWMREPRRWKSRLKISESGVSNKSPKPWLFFFFFQHFS